MTSVANKLLLIRPRNFQLNSQTRNTNSFQASSDAQRDCRTKAREEFDALETLLREKRFELLVFDTTRDDTPDSLFPNNWISFHANQKLVTYPMYAPNRRLERRADILRQFHNYHCMDLSSFEEKNLFLEGTGSLVLDRRTKKAYMAKSPRSSEKVLRQFCKAFDYDFLSFKAVDRHQQEIYHTNVMMSLGESIAVVCSESLSCESERDRLIQSLYQSERQIIEVSMTQMENFAGNILLAKNQAGQAYWLMSTSAFQSFTATQKLSLRKDGDLLHSDISCIETLGGGSIRCMIAEVF